MPWHSDSTINMIVFSCNKHRQWKLHQRDWKALEDRVSWRTLDYRPSSGTHRYQCHQILVFCTWLLINVIQGINHFKKCSTVTAIQMFICNNQHIIMHVIDFFNRLKKLYFLCLSFGKITSGTFSSTLWSGNKDLFRNRPLKYIKQSCSLFK